jgi:hypothetical protein
VALKNEGDPVASRITFTHNLTDLAADTALIKGKNNQSWRSARSLDQNFMVVSKPVLRDPAKRDFRLIPGTPALEGGIVIGADGKPTEGKTYIGAFGPGARWVEPNQSDEAIRQREGVSP